MTPVATPAMAAPPVDPVETALNDPATRQKLLNHASFRLRTSRGAKGLGSAEDAVQEALSRAWSQRADFNPSKGAPLGWLFGILNHVLLEQGRHSQRQPLQPDCAIAEWDALEARIADPGELHELLSGLTPDQREIVRMAHIDNLDHREIANHFGISVACSRVRLGRAMKELRQLANAKEGGR